MESQSAEEGRQIANISACMRFGGIHEVEGKWCIESEASDLSSPKRANTEFPYCDDKSDSSKASSKA